MKPQRVYKTMAAGMLGVVLLSSSAHGQSADALINKLIEKGILTQDEAESLRRESTNNFKGSLAGKTEIPAWVEKVKFGGDFRGRYDGAYQDESNTGSGSATEDRQRFRYRLRSEEHTSELQSRFGISY